MDSKLLESVSPHATQLLRPTVQQDSPFLSLPLEIVYLVTEELPISAQILLSQTCKTLWHQTRRQCSTSLRLLSADQRFETLTEVVNFLPDYYPCTRCRKLVPICYDDFPTNKDRWVPDSKKPCSSRLYYSDRECVFGLGPFYLRHAHLATKLTRMGTYHQDYLQKLLRKHDSHSPDASCRPDFSTCRYIFEPRVVRNRFVLMTTFILPSRSKRISVRRFLESLIDPCAHTVKMWIREWDNWPLRREFEKAFDSPNGNKHKPQRRAFSCDRCPTDFRIDVKMHEACVTYWSDFGTCLTLQDACWQTHASNFQNRSLSGSSFKNEHGSIRELYFSLSS